MSEQTFKVEKLSQHIGAEIQGIDLSRELSGDVDF